MENLQVAVRGKLLYLQIMLLWTEADLFSSTKTSPQEVSLERTIITYTLGGSGPIVCEA